MLRKVVLLLKDHRVLSASQCGVDEVVLPELRSRGLADPASDRLQHVEHATVDRVALLLHQLHALRDEPVEGSRAGIDDKAALLPHFRDAVMDVSVVHQRALRLWHHARPLYLHRPPAADVMLAQYEPLQRGALLCLEGGHRQPDDEQVYAFHLHVVKRPSEHGEVFGCLAIALVHLLGVEDVSRQMNIGPDLIDQPIDRDAHRLAPAAHRVRRFIAFGRIGDRWEVRAPEVASVHTRNEFRVAEADIERAYDGFHAFLQSASRTLQGSLFAPFLSSRNRAFWAGLSASGHTVGALHCDYVAT